MKLSIPFYIAYLIASSSHIMAQSDSCQMLPTAGSLATTPFSTATTTFTTGSVTQVALVEYFESITYVSNCSPSTSIGTTTIPVF
ncbi:hypothetical protein HG535_0B05600 [Zygotorulaspora mrakii]|uniref:Uncharacterized protein n=1 Tax=Zygotorulaspora mrakii TaxID=42260 RepID=A0A7H9AZB5_ZYGMR|nr:uncharacterized protein HG535_0B05600 [Zygotorulaspora mrakii]QLG71517.1 hypothetical protein HG535_0B05600 [Zygotorulaspora mrakii]